MPLIKIRNLKREFKTGEVVTKVLHGLSFDIKEEQFFVFGLASAILRAFMTILA